MLHTEVVLLFLIFGSAFLSGITHGRQATLANDESQYHALLPNHKLVQNDTCIVHSSSHMPPRKANAVILMLTRNSDLKGVMSSMKQLEDRFNKNFGYPYVFLNDEPFDAKFKNLVTQLTRAPVEFGLIPPEHWNQPPWINETKASAARDELVAKNIAYGGSVSYRNMCRFNSGFFYRHELLKPYKYYWRFEPSVDFFCDIDYDPFLYMQDHDKVYGFTISLYEYIETIPTLWSVAKEFMDANPELIAPNNAMNFISYDGGTTYNQCHFWSNFEIGDLDFWRGEAYSKFFDFLDKKGGFYYERWGDAPVHSIAVALFARQDQLVRISRRLDTTTQLIFQQHFFHDIGYHHNPFQHCPRGDTHRKGRCWCDPDSSFGERLGTVTMSGIADPYAQIMMAIHA